MDIEKPPDNSLIFVMWVKTSDFLDLFTVLSSFKYFLLFLVFCLAFSSILRVVLLMGGFYALDITKWVIKLNSCIDVCIHQKKSEALVHSHRTCCVWLLFGGSFFLMELFILGKQRSKQTLYLAVEIGWRKELNICLTYETCQSLCCVNYVH